MDNFNLAAESSALKRRQAVIDSLMQQAMAAPQGQMVGQFYVPSGLGGALRTIGSALMARHKQGQLDSDSADFKQRYNTALDKELTDFDTARAENPRSAAIKAMTSDFAPIQDMGKMTLAELGRKKNYATVGGIVFDPENGSIVKLSGPQPVRKKDGNVIYEENPSTGQWEKLDKSPVVNVKTNVVNQQEGAFAKKMGEKAADSVEEAQKGLKSNQKLRVTMDKLSRLNTQGVSSGPTAGAKMFLAQLGDSMGIAVDRNQLLRDEAYNNQIMSNVAEILTASNGVGRSFTDADREAFMQSFPTMLQSPQGRKEIIARIKHSLDQSDAGHRRTLDLARKAPGSNPLFVDIGSQVSDGEPLEAAPASTSSVAPVDFNAYIKRKR